MISAVDQIRTHRGWAHRKWRKAMFALCKSAAEEGAGLLTPQPMQSALICICAFERINKITFDPTNEGHAFLVRCYSRYARLFWHIDRMKTDSTRKPRGC